MFPAVHLHGGSNKDTFITTPVINLFGHGQHPTRTLDGHQNSEKHKDALKQQTGNYIKF